MKPEETDKCERVKGPKKLDLLSLGLTGEEECLYQGLLLRRW